jgi:hypothetical protein
MKCLRHYKEALMKTTSAAGSSHYFDYALLVCGALLAAVLLYSWVTVFAASATEFDGSNDRTAALYENEMPNLRANVQLAYQDFLEH